MVTPRAPDCNRWSHSKSGALIWLTSAIIFYSLFQVALHNSSRYETPTAPDPLFSGSMTSNAERRSKLYDKMERDLDENGAAFLKRGETSQSLSLSDIFTLKDGSVTPVLKAVNPPVRANVLYLSKEYSVNISEAVKNIFSSYFDKNYSFPENEDGVIFLTIASKLQPYGLNSSLYHFSMFHASNHVTPVPATEDEIEAEARAVHSVADALCPLQIVLDRVVLTSTGVLLGCWQVISGTDPITIRDKLRTALPHAPQKQSYDAAILHTSFARLLGHPKVSPMEVHKTSDEVQFFHELVARLNNHLQGFKAVVSELWYVEEYDLLALALDGRMKVRRFQLGCSKNPTFGRPET